MIRIDDLVVEAGRSGGTPTADKVEQSTLVPKKLDVQKGMSFGSKVALVGAGSIVVAIFVLFESGLLAEWLRDKFYDPSRSNSEFFRKIITAGTLAHWKKRSGAVPVTSEYRDMESLLAPESYKSLIELYDTVAVDGVLSVLRNGVSYGEIVNVKDYDLYETLILEDDLGVKYYCIAFDPRVGAYVFRNTNGALVELRRAEVSLRAYARDSIRRS